MEVAVVKSNIFSYEYLKPKVDKEIKLTDSELTVFSKIKGVINKHKLSSNIRLRVVGGWVRSKLLGEDCNDIDITIVNAKASDLVTLLDKELNTNDSKVFIKESNPEKFRNFSVATTTIEGISIDFVDLGVTYSNDLSGSENLTEINLSDLEKQEIDSARKDAYRRDITINSIFYNLETSSIEDFTGQGLSDMANGIIRSPIDSALHLSQDPMSVFKSIKFALKYGFKLSDDFDSALMEDKNTKIIRKGLEKLNIHRLTKEVNKIFAGKNPHIGFYLLYKYNLLDLLIVPNDKIKGNVINNTNIYDYLVDIVNISGIANTILDSFLTNFSFLFENVSDIKDLKEKLFNILLFILPVKENYEQSQKFNVEMKYLLAKTLKTENAFNKTQNIIISNLDKFRNFALKGDYSKIDCGVLMRMLSSDNFSVSVVLGVALDYYSEVHNNHLQEVLFSLNMSKIKEILQRYEFFYKYLEKEGIMNADKLPQLLSGSEISNIIREEKLNVKDFFKIIPLLIDEIFCKQVENASFSKEDAIRYSRDYINKLV